MANPQKPSDPPNLRREAGPPRRRLWAGVVAVASTIVTLLVFAGVLTALAFSPVGTQPELILTAPALSPSAGSPARFQTVDAAALDRKAHTFLPVFGISGSRLQFRESFVQLAAPNRVLRGVDYDGQPQLVDSSAAAVTLSREFVPDALRPWIGELVRVDESCTATIDRIDLLWRVSGNLDYVLGYSTADAPNLRAIGIVELGAPVYAGHLQGCPSDVEVPLRYARPMAAPPLLIAQPLPLGEATKPVVLEAQRIFRRSEAVARAQREYLSFEDAQGHWLDHAAWGSHAFVGKGHRGVLVIYAAVTSHCDRFEGGAWGVFAMEVMGQDKTAHIKLGPMLGAQKQWVHGILGAVDADGDGQLDIDGVFDYVSSAVYDTAGRKLSEMSEPFQGCHF